MLFHWKYRVFFCDFCFSFCITEVFSTIFTVPVLDISFRRTSWLCRIYLRHIVGMCRRRILRHFHRGRIFHCNPAISRYIFVCSHNCSYHCFPFSCCRESSFFISRNLILFAFIGYGYQIFHCFRKNEEFLCLPFFQRHFHCRFFDQLKWILNLCIGQIFHRTFQILICGFDSFVSRILHRFFCRCNRLIESLFG